MERNNKQHKIKSKHQTFSRHRNVKRTCICTSVPRVSNSNHAVFIRFDFSDLPALIGAFAYGPLAGVIVEFIKNLLHCTVTQSFTVGELSNFILGAVFTGTAGLIYKKNKTKKGAIIGAIVGSVIMGIISFPSNLFIVYPAYEKFTPINEIMDAYSKLLPSVGKLWQALLIFNVPFTIVKGLISTLITVLIYKRLSPVLKGRG